MKNEYALNCNVFNFQCTIQLWGWTRDEDIRVLCSRFTRSFCIHICICKCVLCVCVCCVCGMCGMCGKSLRNSFELYPSRFLTTLHTHIRPTTPPTPTTLSIQRENRVFFCPDRQTKKAMTNMTLTCHCHRDDGVVDFDVVETYLW